MSANHQYADRIATKHPPQKWYGSFDVGRIMAGLFLVFYHMDIGNPRDYVNDPIGFNEMLLATISRYALPYFFCVSGFLLASMLQRREQPTAAFIVYLKQLLFLYACWAAIYIVLVPILSRWDSEHSLLKIWYWSTANFFNENPQYIIFSGGGGPVWYLSGLIFCASVLFVSRKIGGTYFLLAVGLGLYMVETLSEGYKVLPSLGMGFASPFFACVFMAIGWHFAERPHPTLRTALLLTVFGYVIYLFELRILVPYLDIEFDASHQTRLFGLIPFAGGVFLIALALKTKISFRLAKAIAPYMMGVFLTHFLFLLAIRPFREHNGGPLSDLSVFIIVSSCSLLLSYLLFCFKTTKPLMQPGK